MDKSVVESLQKQLKWRIPIFYAEVPTNEETLYVFWEKLLDHAKRYADKVPEMEISSEVALQVLCTAARSEKQVLEMKEELLKLSDKV